MLGSQVAGEGRWRCESHAEEVGLDPGDTAACKAVVKEEEPDCCVWKRSEGRGGRLEAGDRSLRNKSRQRVMGVYIGNLLSREERKGSPYQLPERKA